MVDFNRRLDYDKEDLNIQAIPKGSERYIFIYDDASRAEALRCFVRFASNSDLSFTCYDATVLSQEMRQIYEDTQKGVWDDWILEHSDEYLEGLLVKLFEGGLRDY